MLHESAKLRENRDRFLQRVAAAERVWALRGPDGFAVCDSNPPDDDDEPRPVLLFWSDEAYADAARKAEYPDHTVADLSLFDFLFRWLPGMEKDGVLAGTNYTADLAGLETEPMALQDQLLEAMPAALAKSYVDRLKSELGKK